MAHWRDFLFQLKSFRSVECTTLACLLKLVPMAQCSHAFLVMKHTDYLFLS